MNDFVLYLILFSLAVQVVPAGISFRLRSNKFKTFQAVLVMAVMQAVMISAGAFLSATFMHLIEDWKNGIVLAVFFVIGIRMMMDAFNIRKGKTAYHLETPLFLLLTAIAQSINTFLAGMMFYFFPEVSIQKASWLLLGLAALMMLYSVWMAGNKQAKVMAALLYVIAAVIFISSSFFLAITH